MKIRHIILVILLIILGLAGFGLQTFLTEGLATTLNQKIFPDIQAEYGLKLSVENATVNLLQRRARLEGLTIRNLDGYHVPSLLTVRVCKLNLDLPSLLKRDPVIVKSVEAAGAQLIIERSREGRVNIQELKELFSGKKPPSEQLVYPGAPLMEDTPAAPVTAAETPAPQEAESTSVHIRRLSVEGTATYIDQKQRLKLPLDLRLTASDLFSTPATNQPGSLIVLRGAQADNPEALVVDLNAILEPLVDPDNPSFNVSGSVSQIGPDLLGDILTKNDMICGTFSIKPSITCKQSRLKGSEVDLTLSDLQYRDVAIGDTELNLPLNGTLQDPTVDLTSALQSLFEKSSMNFLKALGMDVLDNSSTNQPAPGKDGAGSKSKPAKTLGDVLAEELGEKMKEVDENKELKDSLKLLGDSLFGN